LPHVTGHAAPGRPAVPRGTRVSRGTPARASAVRRER